MPPWEKYSSPAAEGPWAKYGGAPAAEPQPELSTGDYAADILKSGGIGLAKGAIGLAGLPGDLQRLAQTGADYIDPNHKFFTPENKEMSLPGSGDIQKGVEGYTGEFYKPKTTPGKYAETVGEFAPGGFAKKAVDIPMRALTRVLLPALGSESAGQLAEGTAAEPAARIVGALTGSVLGHKATVPKSVVPNKDELFAEANRQYEGARALGVEYKPDAVRDVAVQLRQRLDKMGIDDTVAEKTLRQVSKLETPPDGTVAATYSNVENARKKFGTIAGSNDPTERKAASISKRAIDEFLESPPAGAVSEGQEFAAKTAADLAKTARGNFSAASDAKNLDKKMVRAEMRANAANSGTNVGNTMRQRVADMLIRESEVPVGRSAEELAQMQRVVEGSRVGNALRYTSNLFGGGGGLGQFVVGSGSAGAAYATGDPRFLAIPALGFGARALANRSTMKEVEKLNELLRSKAPLAKALLASAPQQRTAAGADPIVAALLAANSSQGPMRIPAQ